MPGRGALAFAALTGLEPCSTPSTRTRFLPAILGSEARFPVHRIYCIGRNYAEHAKEMGAEVVTAHPVFFMKPADAVVSDGADVCRIRRRHRPAPRSRNGGRAGQRRPRHRCRAGRGVRVRLRRRSGPDPARPAGRAKAKGLPWDAAKGFDHSAPVSALRRAARRPSRTTVLRLSVNGELRQQRRIAT